MSPAPSRADTRAMMAYISCTTIAVHVTKMAACQGETKRAQTLDHRIGKVAQIKEQEKRANGTENR